MIARTFDEVLRTPRARLVMATLAQKRAEHPELRAAPSLAALYVVAKREHIIVHDVARAHWIAGFAMHALGVGLISLNEALAPSERRCVFAHELGHIMLGHCTDGVLRAWLGSECGAWWSLGWRCDGPLYMRTEHEADLFGAALLGMSLRTFRATIEPYYDRRDGERAAA